VNRQSGDGRPIDDGRTVLFISPFGAVLICQFNGINNIKPEVVHETNAQWTIHRSKSFGRQPVVRSGGFRDWMSILILGA
jgi:MoaA/NifB/PqqE/SkfB family radical SAM enzyme